MKIRLIPALVAVCLGAAAHAGLFDEISKAADKIRQAGDTVQQGSDAVGSMPTGNTQDQPGAKRERNTLAGGSYQLPQNLTPYPNAKPEERVDNPFDTITIPVSLPVEGPDGYLAPQSVPMEGRVTMLQYTHRSDDSPILITRHYRNWLTEQGFEQIDVCIAPCKAAASSRFWEKVDDASDRIHSSLLPDNATYIAAYKPGVMALVGVGTYSDHFTSFVKVVEGKVIDLAVWERAKAGHKVTGAAPATGGKGGATTPPAGTTAGALTDGSDLVPKLSSLKLLASPSKDAKVVATLSVSDGLVYMGSENGGYLQVTTSQGEGWVDRRLVRQP